MSTLPLQTGLRSRRDTAVAATMFALSIVFFMLLAGLLYSHHAHNIPDQPAAGAAEEAPPSLDWDTVELRIQLVGLALVWPIFPLEGVWLLVTQHSRRRRLKVLGWLFLVTVAPPVRIAGRPTDQELWLPRLGWQPIDRDLRKTLERFFSVPMIVIALMVLPILAVEYGWRSQVEARPGLQLSLEIANSAIWLAFAVEFTVMIAVAENKLRYCALHWVDLAIILLPVVYITVTLLPQLIQHAPVLRALRLLRLNQLSRMGRVYRMQGLALKAWRAFLILDVIQRLIGRSLEKQLKQLEELLAAKEEEVQDLRREIDALKKRIAEQKLAEVNEATRPRTGARIPDRN